MRKKFLGIVVCSIFLLINLIQEGRVWAGENDEEVISLKKLEKQGWEIVWENNKTRVLIHPKYIRPMKEKWGYNIIVKFSPGPDTEKVLREKLENLKVELFANEKEIPDYWNDFVKVYIEEGNSYAYTFSLLCDDKKLLLTSVRSGDLFSTIVQVDIDEEGYGKAIFQKLCDKQK